jgi:hypothetical protein
MKEEHSQLFEKMARLIDTAKPEHKRVVERYLSLCNKKLHNDIDKKNYEWNGIWGIIGGSMGIEERFKSVFGTFNEQVKFIKG